MKRRYYGGLISATKTVVNTSSASGIFNPTQQMQAKRAGNWPTPAAPPIPYNLWSWGQNSYGNLGLGNTNLYSSPKQVGSLTNWKTIAAGGHSGYSIKTDGTFWAWGRNGYGRLGLGNTTPVSSPTQVGALANWESVSAGLQCFIAVKTDGTLWSWGYNSYGNLGFNDTANRSSPVQVGLLTTWLSLPKMAVSSAPLVIKG